MWCCGCSTAAPKEVIIDCEESLLPNAAPPKLRFLAAEDNLVNQRLIARLLESAGHSVTVVGDGLAAVNASQQNSYDAILMDVQMPHHGRTRSHHGRFAGWSRQPVPMCRSLP